MPITMYEIIAAYYQTALNILTVRKVKLNDG